MAISDLLNRMGYKVYKEPFPHLIIKNLYNKKEFDLVWEELKFYTKPGKLMEAKNYGGLEDKTNARALLLDEVYATPYRDLSNILTVNRKLFSQEILFPFSKIHHCCAYSKYCNGDITKVRYYHNGEFYKPHTDYVFDFLIFSYFNKEPKKFSGGELYFPNHNYTYTCDNNSAIMLPAWVEHGVKEVKINDSDYYDGYGRYAITSFLKYIEK